MRTAAFLFVLLTMTGFELNAQTTILLCADDYSIENCHSVPRGTTIRFKLNTGADCENSCFLGTDLVISNPQDLSTQMVVSPINGEYSVAFSVGGTYIVECSGGTGMKPMKVICVVSAVPTLGSWAVIILLLILMGFGVGQVWLQKDSLKFV